MHSQLEWCCPQGAKKNLAVTVLYSPPRGHYTYTDMQFICGIKISQMGKSTVRQTCLPVFLREAIMKERPRNTDLTKDQKAIS